MKFSKHLEEYQIREWKGLYLQYDMLKKLLAEISSNPRLSPTSRPPQGFGADPANPELPDDPIASWQRLLQTEFSRIGKFVDAGLRKLENQVQELSRCCPDGMPEPISGSARQEASSASSQAINDQLEDAAISSTAPPPISSTTPPQQSSSSQGSSPVTVPAATGGMNDDGHLELRVLQVVGHVQDAAAQLRSFAELNHAALYKVLKKHDKLLERSDGLTEILPRLVSETKICDPTRWDAIDVQLRRLSHCGGPVGSTPAAVVQLAHGLDTLGGRSGAARRSGIQNSERALFFFLGSSLALFMSILVMICLPIPELDDDKFFSAAYFLAPFPVFRVWMSVLLVYWSIGGVASVCIREHINHMFVLHIDPRCRIGPRTLFASAALMTSAWILIFGTYVVDYKWAVFPEIHSDRSISSRSSSHFVIYPILVIIVGLFECLLRPSASCTYRFRMNLLKSVGRTLAAPLFVVSFADNMTGDVATSLAKPLQDIPAAFCYLFSAHPQTAQDVREFTDHGDTCSDWVHDCMNPCIAALPFVCRSFQCLRRYYDTKQGKHLINFGKYVASLLVVVVSALRPSDSTNVIIVSVCATIYAFVWDVTMDWGLSRADFGLMFSKRPQDDAGSMEKRTFSASTYAFCVILDLVGRLSWVNTLLPLEVITSNVVLREILKTSLTIVEICRRSMWAVLRIEWEQVSNASGFRALLWVPDRFTAELTPMQFDVDSVIEEVRERSLTGNLSRDRSLTGTSAVMRISSAHSIGSKGTRLLA